MLVIGCRDAPDPAAPPAVEAAPCDCGGDEKASAPTGPQPFEQRRAEVFGQLRELVADLQAEGRYDCCTKAPCNHCALMAGGCSCEEGLKRGEPVCEECGYLWLKGQGDVPGIEPKDVRTFYEAERAGQR